MEPFNTQNKMYSRISHIKDKYAKYSEYERWTERRKKNSMIH